MNKVVCLLAVLISLPAIAEPRVTVVLGTATTGGGFEVYGSALARVVEQVDPALRIEARKTAGSLENIALLGQGKLDMALVQGEAMHEAFSQGPGDGSRLRVVAAMYPTAGMFVVRSDSPYRSIEDLKGRPVVFGARGSGLVLLARLVLDGMGLDMNRDFSPILLDRAAEGSAMLLDGRAAAIWGGGRGWPVFAAAMEMPGGARFIAPTHEQIDSIRGRYPFLKAHTLPANTYRGQETAIPSIGSWSFILARNSLPEDTVHRFCRALHAAAPKFAELLPQASDTTIENTVLALDRRERLHAGASRCLKEQGALH